jgi:hypothetical protein
MVASKKDKVFDILQAEYDVETNVEGGDFRISVDCLEGIAMIIDVHGTKLVFISDGLPEEYIMTYDMGKKPSDKGVLGHTKLFMRGMLAKDNFGLDVLAGLLYRLEAGDFDEEVCSLANAERLSKVKNALVEE